MRLRLHGDTLARAGMLDFAVNVWPNPLPAALKQVLRHALEQTGRYPEEREAREAVAARHGRDVEEVLLLNGACEAFWLLAHAVRPRLAACIHPGFTEAEAALRAVGSEIARVFREPQRWTFDPAQVSEQATVVVLDNPNNPTGTLEPAETVTALARRGLLLVVDESFIDFVPDEQASLAGRSDVPGLVVVRSLTKLWALPGIRAGYLLAAADIVRRLAAQRQPWSVNRLACAALAVCADDRQTPRQQVAGEVAAARSELLEAFGQLPGVRVWPSAANFLLLELPHGPHVVEALRQRGIAVRPAASFPGLSDDHIRVAVRRPEENAQLLAALAEVLA